MRKFEIIDISGDIGIRAWGENLEQLFVNTALGMYSLITDLEKIDERKTVEIATENSSVESLLISWLNELIFEFDAYNFLGRNISISEIKNNELRAVVSGERFDLQKHEKKLLIKAATYHMLKVEKKNNIWESEVIFDI
ncbi:MAG: archease [Nitrospiraceae bacterium]|nr:archease [Nitrospiraceae bacterium]